MTIIQKLAEALWAALAKRIVPDRILRIYPLDGPLKPKKPTKSRPAAAAAPQRRDVAAPKITIEQ